MRKFRSLACPATIRFIYAICMAGGALNHIGAILEHGLFWNYDGIPPQASRVFWTSLALFDSIAALMLFAKPRLGIVLTASIIMLDVAHNTWFLLAFTLPLNPNLRFDQLWPYAAQVLFLIFVAVTMHRAWPTAERESSSS